jgi:integrase
MRTKADGTVIFESQMRIDGKVRRVVHRDVVTKTEAVNAHRRLTVGVEEGAVKVGDRTLTLTALVEDFLGRERGVLASRKPSTVDLYEQRLRSHVLPTLGTLKAEDLRVQHVRALVDRMRAKGQGGSSIRGTVAALSAALQHGERHLGTPVRNVCRDLCRGELPSSKRKSEPHYLSLPEVEKLLAAMTDESRPVAAACFWGGLRVSEALALTWAGVDFAAGTVAVPGTKTEGSAATIPLLPALARELRAHRERQAGIGDALVFQTASGKPVHRRNVLRAVNAASEKAKLVAEGQERVGVHDLRHSLAANAFGLGLPAPEVARLLRHANTAVTLSTYAGITDQAATALGGKLASAGFGA